MERDSASRAQLQNCAINAAQKSNQCGGAIAPTATRPCRGVKNALRKCSSAFLAFLTRQGDSEALPPKDILCGCRKDPTGCKQSAAKTATLYLFRGWGERGEGNPFFFCDTQDSKKLENIRENASLRNLESTESSPTDSKVITESKEILNNEQKQSPSGVEPSTDSESRFKVLELDSESSSTEPNTDSKTSTESKEILNNAQRQNLSPKESTESKADLESKPNAFTESSPIDSVTSTESKAEILKMCKDRI